MNTEQAAAPPPAPPPLPTLVAGAGRTLEPLLSALLPCFVYGKGTMHCTLHKIAGRLLLLTVSNVGM